MKMKRKYRKNPKLETILDLPVIHLDSLYWQPGWVETPKADWHTCVESLIAKDQFVNAV